MNLKQLVRLSNLIGIVSILLLIYWVFTFLLITVFDLRVFREDLTDTFYMSILGILALMAGALMMNLMFNLTRIAQKHNADELFAAKGTNKIGWILLLLFPVLVLLLFGGDFITSTVRERTLTETARSIIDNNSMKMDHLLRYEFTYEWGSHTESILRILSETDSDFPQISVIVEDTLMSEPVYLMFTPRMYFAEDTVRFNDKKTAFMFKSSRYERDYFQSVFHGNNEQTLYQVDKGNYELFYPVKNAGKQMVLRFSQYERYGKIGSR